MNLLFKYVNISVASLKLSKDIVRKCSTLESCLYSHPHMHENSEQIQTVLKVSVIGMPNAGKSTFINNLMDRKVCPTSSKVHTTRTKATAIFTENNAQIIFLDTPGLVTNRIRKKHHLEETFIKDSETCLQRSDAIGVIHDVSNAWTRDRLDVKVVNLLQRHRKKSSFLVLNKVDLIKSKRKLLEVARLITMNSLNGNPMPQKNETVESENRGWPYFNEIFMVSALTGNGLSDVKNFLIKSAKPSNWLYPEDTFSDQAPENIIVNTVKATLLDFLPQEIPYQLEPEIELFEVNDGIINAVVLVKCISERVAVLVAGAGDGRLRQITERTQRNLQDVFQHFVRIRIHLQSPKENK